MSLFRFFHEYTFEVDFPVEKVWEYTANVDHWFHTHDQIESLTLEDSSLKSGSIVKAKVKNRTRSVPIKVSEVVPLKKIAFWSNPLLFKQESVILFEALGPNKTRVTHKTSIKSILIPFLRSYLTKGLNNKFPSEVEKMIQTLSS